ncbi:MAG: response regulator [Lacibacter sp.]|jgi:CheY-like chemotaxis protein
MINAVLSINANKAMNYVIESIINHQYDVIAVNDIYSAAEQLKKRQDIKTIVLDVDNTQANVWDFIHHIKTSRFFNRPIIVLTSDKSLAQTKKVEETKIRYLLYKPFAPSEILKKISEVESIVNHQKETANINL